MRLSGPQSAVRPEAEAAADALQRAAAAAAARRPAINHSDNIPLLCRPYPAATVMSRDMAARNKSAATVLCQIDDVW